MFPKLSHMLLVGAFACVTSGYSQTAFQDSFSNDIPANSDSETGIWTLHTTAPSTQTESGGKLTQVSASASGSDNPLTSLSTPVQSRFNFFTRQLKFGASITMDGTTAQTWMSRGRLILAPTTGRSSPAPTALGVLFREQQSIGLTRKQDAAYVEVDNAGSSKVTKLIGPTSEGLISYTGDFLTRFEFVMNDSVFQLTTFGGGKGSGVLRFTGSHGITPANWGSGDTAITLETLRIAAAGGTTTTSIWDDVRVEEDSSPIAAEPYWDFQATYPRTSGTITGNYRLWLPKTESVIRGIIFLAPGSGEDFRYFVHDRIAQEAARAMGFGLIGYTNAANMNLFGYAGSPASLSQTAMQAVLDQAAAVSGHPEIANAPVCMTGLSAGGFDSTILADKWPERLIGYVAHRGANTVPAALSEASKQVVGILIAGSVDYNGLTGPEQIRNIFEGWRAKGARIAFSVDWGIGHTPAGNQGWEATFSFLKEIADLRYPRPMQPSTTPGAGIPTFLNVPLSSGWLAEAPDFTSMVTPVSTNPFLPIAAYAAYSGDAALASWLPNESTARIYRALTSTDLVTRSTWPRQGPLRFSAPVQYADSVRAGHELTLTIDPREADDVHPITMMEFFDGPTPVGTKTDGPPWSIPFTPATVGVHSITAVSTDSTGTKRDAFRTITVVSSPRQVWNDAHFPPGTPVANTADQDSDGYPELQEYALGLDPAVPNAPREGFSCLSPATAGQPLQFRFRRNTNATDLAYQVEASSDLITWTILAVSTGGRTPTGPATIQETTLSGEAAMRSVTVTDTVPFNQSDRRFLRLRILEK